MGNAMVTLIICKWSLSNLHGDHATPSYSEPLKGVKDNLKDNLLHLYWVLAVHQIVFLFPNSHYKSIMQHFYSSGLNTRDGFFSFPLRPARRESVRIFNKLLVG